jgi:hypothetical protein
LYSENRTKIRRFLRDPEGNICEDAFLLGLWNDEQRLFSRENGLYETPLILRVPPQFQMSYCFDCEWAQNQHAQGRSYRFGVYNRQSPMVCTALWELEALGISTGADAEQGTRFTHPWEAYAITSPADLAPNWWPSDFHSVVLLAYDNEPLEPITWKQMVAEDLSYRSTQGEPQNFVIKDDLSEEFYLYPRPAAVWDDVTGSGMVIDTDFATETAETGTILDATGAETTATEGAAFDYLRSDDNILLIYKNRLPDIVDDTDELGLPRYLQKYLEHGVLSCAYRANTDAKIQSLADYWEWRKTIGKQALLRFRYLRLSDRDFRLTGGQAAPRQRKGPKLPSHYPPI